jgi:hypothetical protein
VQFNNAVIHCTTLVLDSSTKPLILQPSEYFTHWGPKEFYVINLWLICCQWHWLCAYGDEMICEWKMNVRFWYWIDVWEMMKWCYECEILILKWCLRNDEIMLWMWDFDIEIMFEKWWNCVKLWNYVMSVRFWYWNDVWETMKLCYGCEILILKWCLRNGEIVL